VTIIKLEAAYLPPVPDKFSLSFSDRHIHTTQKVCASKKHENKQREKEKIDKWPHTSEYVRKTLKKRVKETHTVHTAP
jgi:hypothetical protein